MAYEPINTGSTILVSGAKEVSDPNIKATSKVFTTNAGVGGTIGVLSVSISAGSSFIISSANVLDTSVVNYFIVY